MNILNNEKTLVLEEIAAKEKTTGKRAKLYPTILIYYTGKVYARLSETRDLIWNNIIPERYAGYTIQDLYKKNI